VPKGVCAGQYGQTREGEAPGEKGLPPPEVASEALLGRRTHDPGGPLDEASALVLPRRHQHGHADGKHCDRRRDQPGGQAHQVHERIYRREYGQGRHDGQRHDTHRLVTGDGIARP
jgi:hypothetical protein